MTYIIENVNLLKDSSLIKTSLLINKNRIEAIKPSFKRFSYMRMDGSPFLMTSPYILFEPQLPFENSFQNIKQYYINELIKKGCTAFLTYASVNKEYKLKSILKGMKTKLLNSPIDFIIGVKIPVTLITPTFIRECKKEKIPAIFVEVENSDDLTNVPWGWIKEALFPYNCPLVPIFKQDNVRTRRQTAAKWTTILTEEKIPYIREEIPERLPISKENLCKLGIIPIKSYINLGAEVSYNLYQMTDEVNKIEESKLFLYDNLRPLFTIHKGTVIRAAEEVLFRPGFGEHVMIKIPSFFIES